MENYRLFISYAREDKEVASRLYTELKTHPALSPWLDTHNLLAGSNWKDEILTEIETSNFILILLSSKSITKDGFFQREMREAIERISLLAPGNRVIIPLRIEECEPMHRELRLLNYLDLYPDWNDGINRLYKSIGVQPYTHTYRVTGTGRNDRAYLTPIDKDSRLGDNLAFAYVNLQTLPEIDEKKIPTSAMRREGGPINILVELWSIARDTYVEPFYRKTEWSTLDEMLFNERSDDDKKELMDVFIRQWAYAQEQKSTYRPGSWYALHRLIQDYSSW